jgi:hypothetical protein
MWYFEYNFKNVKKFIGEKGCEIMQTDKRNLLIIYILRFPGT